MERQLLMVSVGVDRESISHAVKCVKKIHCEKFYLLIFGYLLLWLVNFTRISLKLLQEIF